MIYIKEAFKVSLADDKMSATLNCTDAYNPEENELQKSLFISFLTSNKVTYGLNEENIELVLSGPSATVFPLTIATGLEKQNGIDGHIEYWLDYSSDVVRGDNWDFRKVMNIPSVTEDQKLATLTLPTKGIDGMNVSGSVVRGKDGKKHPVRVGKGVKFEETDLTFYATTEGQVSITERMIQIHSTFEVQETLSMKTGDLDFVGSIVIRGNVPTGYTVKAEGDIKIFGIVESATVIAGGSIFISEGLAGLQKGFIQAGENIHIGYINQGIAYAGDTIFVENSVVHSECTAKNKLFCQQGNIIGGSLSVGQSVEAKDIGNRLSTETIINFGLDKTVDEQQTKLELEKKELVEKLGKLTLLGEKIAVSQAELTPQIRITLLRQRNSQSKVEEKIKEIDDELAQTNAYLGKEEEAELIIRNTIYSNVIIAFGKYKRRINRNRHSVQLKLEGNEIVMNSLE